MSRVGVFCSSVNAIEMCKTEGVADVFQVVKALRIQKPGAVLTAVSDLKINIMCRLCSVVVFLIINNVLCFHPHRTNINSSLTLLYYFWTHLASTLTLIDDRSWIV